MCQRADTISPNLLASELSAVLAREMVSVPELVQQSVR